MKPSNESRPDPDVILALKRLAEGRRAIPFDEFMQVALYEPKLGYYRRDRTRIGYEADTDFLTATVSAPIFGKLIVAACGQILSPARLSDFHFIEVGAERSHGILQSTEHPFRSEKRVGIGESLEIAGPSVVFSNELFDAQPFRRFRFRDAAWRELGVSVSGSGLAEVELEDASNLPRQLPDSLEEGYQIDAPLKAAELAGALCEGDWTGLFLAFDYGKSWAEMTTATPGGTARAYHNHTQSNDLLAFPGQQDLTCHVCWDWIADALSQAGFGPAHVESQEAFFVKHSGEFIASFLAAEATRISREKLGLMQLIHPAHLGQAFQALWAVRRAS